MAPTSPQGSSSEAEAATAPPALYVVLLPYLSPASRLALWRTSKALAKDVWKHAASHHLMLMGVIAPKPAFLRALFKAKPAKLLLNSVDARRPSFIAARAPAPAWYHCVRALTLSGPGRGAECLHLHVDALQGLALLPALQHLHLDCYSVTPRAAARGSPAADASPAPLLRLHSLTSTAAAAGCDTLATLATALDLRHVHTLATDVSLYAWLAQGGVQLPGLRVVDTSDSFAGWTIRLLNESELRALLQQGTLHKVRVSGLRLSQAVSWPGGTDEPPRLGELLVTRCPAYVRDLAALPWAAIGRVTVQACLHVGAPRGRCLGEPEGRSWPQVGPAQALMSLTDAAAAGRLTLQARTHSDVYDPADGLWLSAFRRGFAGDEAVFTINCSGWGWGVDGGARGTAAQLRSLLRLALRCLAPCPPSASLCAPATRPRHTLVLEGLDLRSGCEETLRTLETLPPSFPGNSLCLYDCLGTPPDAAALFRHLPQHITRLVVTQSNAFAKHAMLQVGAERLGEDVKRISLNLPANSYQKVYVRG